MLRGNVRRKEHARFERRENVASTVHTVGTPPVHVGPSVFLSLGFHIA